MASCINCNSAFLTTFYAKKLYKHLVLISTGSLMVSNGLYWSPVVSSGLQWSLVVSSGLYWSLLVSSGLHWSLLVSNGLYWSPVVSTGLQWSPLIEAKECPVLLRASETESLVDLEGAVEIAVEEFVGTENVAKVTQPHVPVKGSGRFRTPLSENYGAQQDGHSVRPSIHKERDFVER